MEHGDVHRSVKKPVRKIQTAIHARLGVSRGRIVVKIALRRFDNVQVFNPAAHGTKFLAVAAAQPQNLSQTRPILQCPAIATLPVQIIIIGHSFAALIVDFVAGIFLQPIPLADFFKAKIVPEKLAPGVILMQRLRRLRLQPGVQPEGSCGIWIGGFHRHHGRGTLEICASQVKSWNLWERHSSV